MFVLLIWTVPVGWLILHLGPPLRCYSCDSHKGQNVDVTNYCSRSRCPAGVLTETTAEIAAALTFAAARRVVEADSFMRNGHYKGWLPTLFIGNLLQNKTVGRSCRRGWSF